MSSHSNELKQGLLVRNGSSINNYRWLSLNYHNQVLWKYLVTMNCQDTGDYGAPPWLEMKNQIINVRTKVYILDLAFLSQI